MNEDLIKTPKDSNFVSKIGPRVNHEFPNSKYSLNGLFRLITLCLTLIISLAILSTAFVKYNQVNNNCTFISVKDN